MHVLLLICGVLAGGGFIGSLFVDDDPQRADRSYLALGAGRYDALDNDEQNTATDVRAEYRFAQRWGGVGATRVHPFAGLEANSDRAVYGLAGVLADMQFGRWVMTPSIGVGAYEAGRSRDLGATLEFRSQFEIGREFAGGYRLSAALSHISNADIGDENPGVEIINLYFSYPLH